MKIAFTESAELELIEEIDDCHEDTIYIDKDGEPFICYGNDAICFTRLGTCSAAFPARRAPAGYTITLTQEAE
jgi:hypothetical protein